jgi:hypothetical protein
MRGLLSVVFRCLQVLFKRFLSSSKYAQFFNVLRLQKLFPFETTFLPNVLKSIFRKKKFEGNLNTKKSVGQNLSRSISVKKRRALPGLNVSVPCLLSKDGFEWNFALKRSNIGKKSKALAGVFNILFSR